MKTRFLFSIIASLLLIAFFTTTNLLTSLQFLWCIFPIFAVLWWPISIYCYDRKSSMLMAILGSFITIVFFVIVNQITLPQFPWCVFPIFIVLWWPLIVYCVQKKKFKLFSILGSLLIIVLLLTTNYITTAKVDWFFYTIFPVPLWSIGMFFKKLFQSVWFYFYVCLMVVGYYILLNILLSPVYPWSIFIAYEILLVITGIYFWQQKKEFWYYFSGIIITIIFLAVSIWLIGLKSRWIYEIAFFSIIIQILLYIFNKRKYNILLFFSSITVLLYLIINNLLYLPGHLWFLYAMMPIIWLWVILLFSKQAKTLIFSILSSLTGILYYTILNLLLSPGHIWFIYPAFALLWWPLSYYYANTKNHLFFAILGCILLITFFICINFLTTPNILWCTFPIFLVLWWPLSIYYFIYKRNKLKQ